MAMVKAYSLDEASRRFAEIIEAVSKRRERVMVKTPEGDSVILMNGDDLESLEETLALVSDPQAMADIREGLEAIRSGRTRRLADEYPRGT